MDTAELRVVGELADGHVDSSRPKRPGHLLGKSQEAALDALAAVSRYLESDADEAALFARLSATIAQQCHAQRAAFWRLGSRGALALQHETFGFEGHSPVHGMRLQLGTDGTGVIEKMLFADRLDLVKGTSAELDAIWRQGGLGVRNSIAAAWRAGDRRIGVVVAYDAAHGFSNHDLWMLRLLGIAAGLLWQNRESEDELGQTAVRLEEAMAARRHLLNNIAAGGDEARRRFASALHDDSLQLLTGAELQLERLRLEVDGSPYRGQLDQLRQTLRRVEDSLRRLLTNVSPEPLQLPANLREAISERLESMRVRAGIEPTNDSSLPDDLPPAIQAIVMKNIGEALNNVEKHARATRVRVMAKVVDGGIRVQVIDDGTGFVVAEAARAPGHIGLVAMRERAQLAGGWCRIESDPGTGTRVDFSVPMSL
jgi:signal transduction histidine kinase